jgi:CheY-like chemotaxis protein
MERKLLVVDDQDSIARVITKIATPLGFEVRTVTAPEAAFDTFVEFKPNVLLLDLVMPEVDGIDVLHKILALGTSTEIIVMSGFGRGYLQLGTDVVAFHDHPPILTLAKPFRKAQLTALLSRVAETIATRQAC